MGINEKSLWRKSLNKFQDFVANPDTKRFANAGAKILNVASQIGQAKLNTPLSIAGAAIGLLDVVANHTKSGFYTSVYETAAKHNMRGVEVSGAVSLLFEQGYFQHAEPLISSDHGSLVAVTIEGKKIAVVLSKDGQLQSYWCAFISEDFTTTAIADLLWKRLGDYITLTFRRDEFDRELLTAAPIEDYEDLDYLSFGNSDPTDFICKFRLYLKAGIRKATLCVGPPGTGKTTFAFRCAQELGGKLMVVTPELLENQRLPRQDIVDIVAAFKPAVLLFEDVDRVNNDRLLLSLMDYIRRANLGTLILSTANDPKNIIGALKRPGRMGPRLMFPAPDLEQRLTLINHFCKKIGIERNLSHLAEKMEHPKFSHDYIRDVCEQALVEMDEELLAYIERIKLDLGEESKSGDKPSNDKPPESTNRPI